MAGSTGLEPGSIVPYLVINIHIVLHAFCEQIVGRTGNFVNSLLAGVYDSRSTAFIINKTRGHVSKIETNYLYDDMILSISND